MGFADMGEIKRGRENEWERGRETEKARGKGKNGVWKKRRRKETSDNQLLSNFC